MGRYLCQLCKTMVNCGEKHPCFLYKNNDNCYSVPDQDELEKIGSKHFDAKQKDTADPIGNFVKCSETELNNSGQSKRTGSCLNENNSRYSLSKASKKKGRFHSFPNKTSCNIQQESHFNTFIPGSVFNAHSHDVRTVLNKNFSSMYSSDISESECRYEDIFRKTSKSKSRITKHLYKKNERKEVESTSNQTASTDKCKKLRNEQNWHYFTNDEAFFPKSPAGASQKVQMNSKNITHFSSLQLLKNTMEDENKGSDDIGNRDAPFDNGTSATESQKGIKEENFCFFTKLHVSAGSSGNCGLVHGQKEEENNEVTQHQSSSELSPQAHDDRDDVVATNTEHLDFVNDPDPIAGPSGINNETQWHSDNRGFTCRVCGKRFLQEDKFHLHYRIHTRKKLISCDKCEKTFTFKWELIRHFRTHSGEKPFICDKCGKSFYQKSHLVEHLRIHTGEKPFTCDKCEKSFSQVSSLTRHILTHTGKKPFKCDNCNKSFSVKCNLTVHLRTHTGEKPFACDKCGKKFITKNGLIKHLQTHPD